MSVTNMHLAPSWVDDEKASSACMNRYPYLYTRSPLPRRLPGHTKYTEHCCAWEDSSVKQGWTVLCILPPQVCSAHGLQGLLFPSPTSWLVPRTSKEQRDITQIIGLKLSTKKADPFCVKPFPQDHQHPMSCGTIRLGERLLYPQGI